MPSETAQSAAVQSQGEGEARPPRADMSSRFLGLVVIPGQQIMKIEVEERPVYGLPVRSGPPT